MNLLSKKRGAWTVLVLRCRAAHLLPALGLSALGAAVSLTAAAPAYAQGSAVLTGTVIDTSTKKPISDVVVTVTSPSLQGEQTVVTDASGSYRIPNLPPGEYTVRLEGDGFKPISRGGVTLRVDSTIRVNMEMLPEGLKAEEVVVVGKAPTVDVGSSSTGVTLNNEFVSRLALTPPGAKGAASHSFESLATVAPGANADAYGVSIAGTTSPENAFVVDGVGVNDPAFGILGTPLSSEFIKEMAVVTGGYMPEYGKAIGGIYDAVTKSGGNEFHGDVWFNITPGALDGPRTQVLSAGSTITVNPTLSSLRDFGADIGGPIVKDKLWFYAGFQLAFSTYNLRRDISQFTYVNDPMHMGAMVQKTDPNTGFPDTTLVSSKTYLATQTATQYIGKLTYLINQDHNLTLSVYGTPTRSGGNGNYSFDSQLNSPPSTILGPYSATGEQVIADSNDVALKYSGAFNNKRQLIDITVAWHHQHQATNGWDGSTVDQWNQPGTAAGTPQIYWRLNSASDPNMAGLASHSIADFESVPTGKCPVVNTWNPSGGANMMGGLQKTNTCPLTQYFSGGPGFMDDLLLDSYQAKAIFTDLLQAAGHHVIKAGIDFSYNSYAHKKAYSGGDLYQEDSAGGSFNDYRMYGFLTGPDQVDILGEYTSKTTTINVGGFVQDSWSIMDKVTLNVGVRYDAQMIYGADGQLGLTLPNQWSPRVGLIYDFTQSGRSKLFANYARYYEGVPLDMADRSFPSEPTAVSDHVSPPCNPATNSTSPSGCSTIPHTPSATGIGTGGRVPQFGSSSATELWYRFGGSKEAVDPNISPQSSDEYVVGGEYEVIPDLRLGLNYVHREMHRAIEDMSRDEANTYFIGNPGFGIAQDFPKAVRNYDALNVIVSKTYSNTWLLQASYTLSRLYGNYAGLFRPETLQLDPNITSDFDLKSLLANQMGPLPGDRTHSIKIFAAKDFLLPAGQDILLGITFRSHSGEPLNALGAHALYGPNEAYVLPRGTGGILNKDLSVTEDRSPWVHSFDTRLGYSVRLSKDTTLTASMDIFNLFDFQAATDLDQAYTFSAVLPCAPGGTTPSCVKHSDGTAFNKSEVNPNYGKPTQYQDPRQWRFGAKLTF